VSWDNVKKKNSLWNGLWKVLRSPASYFVWRDVAMTPRRSPLAQLGDHLAQLSRTKDGRVALERFGVAGMETDGAGDLATLIGQWDGRGGGDRRAEMLETLVSLAPDDEMAALCVVVALRPELTRIARHVAGGFFDAEEAQSEVIAIAWEVLTEPEEPGPEDSEPEESGPDEAGPESPEPGTARAKRAVNAIWNEARRSAGLRRHALNEVSPCDVPDTVAPDLDPLERWPGLLAAAVARGVLTPRQVVVIAQTRMEGRPLAEVARSLGRGYDAVQKDRRRAEAALRVFALSYCAPGSE
jgi:DNA-directed RNA polymerase specialized sigma24 family protein